jgi:hypothetical protein
LFFVPTLVPLTSTEKEQELEAVRFKAAMPIVLPPALAVILPVQFPLRWLGVATTKPGGKVSVAEMLLNVNAEFGFANMKVRDVVPLNGIVATPKLLAIVGGTGVAITVRLALLLVAPGPLSFAKIGPVVLFNVPRVFGAFTFTEITQVASGGFEAGPNVPPSKPMDDEPAIAVNVPPQELVRLFGEAINNPAGKLSVKVIPVSDAFVFGLLTLKLIKVVPFCTTVFGWKSLVIVGGVTTCRVADAELPVPPLLELTGLVLLT